MQIRELRELLEFACEEPLNPMQPRKCKHLLRLQEHVSQVDPQHLHHASQIRRTLTAKFRCGKCLDLFFDFWVTRLASSFVNRLLIARVCLGRRSSGMYFLPL